jgi:glycosyltransferase involved in cell wall biosynthesis
LSRFAVGQYVQGCLMRIAMLVNIPAPYRVPVYDRIAEQCGRDFRVIYMAKLEANRRWTVPALNHDHVYLHGLAVGPAERRIHLRWGVTRQLNAFRPDVIVTCGFNPPMIAAWLHARARRVSHVSMSDGWQGSEADLSSVHRVARHVVYSTSSAFVGASAKTLALFESYGARKNLFKAPLGVDNARFSAAALPLADRRFDIVFAGNLIAGKLPLFFAEVAARIARRRGRVRALVIGDGELRAQTERALEQPGVEVTFTGFLQQHELPAAYASGKIFCFPTRNDAWGMVANEACASGMPVITCANAGCAGELVMHARNGYVLDLDPELWAYHAQRLLDDPVLLADSGAQSMQAVGDYTFAAAADGILAACRAR